ncbi:MAG: sodium/proton-translocating pyrophosphatase [Eubacteriales bacterium]
MSLLLILGLFAAVLGLAYAAFHYVKVKKMDEGTEEMQGVASKIRIGANAFMRYEYKVLLVVTLLAAAILTVIFPRPRCAPARRCREWLRRLDRHADRDLRERPRSPTRRARPRVSAKR